VAVVIVEVKGLLRDIGFVEFFHGLLE
jgi:hypothetical protein